MPKQGFGFQHIPKSWWFIGWLQDLTEQFHWTTNHQRYAQSSHIPQHTTAINSSYLCNARAHCRCHFAVFCSGSPSHNLWHYAAFQLVEDSGKIGEPPWDGCKLKTAGLQELYRIRLLSNHIIYISSKLSKLQWDINFFITWNLASKNPIFLCGPNCDVSDMVNTYGSYGEQSLPDFWIFPTRILGYTSWTQGRHVSKCSSLV